MSGEYRINPLEPAVWSDGADEAESTAPSAFQRSARLSQHIAFLRDFYRTSRGFTDAQLDTIEILLGRLYAKFGLTDRTDWAQLSAEDYPTLSDLYALCEEEYQNFEEGRQLYTEEMLQAVCLGIHSMCVGAEAGYFNGHTNITDSSFLCFGVQGLMESNQRLKDAMLFNVLSYLSHILLTKGNAVAAVDELYLFLTNRTAVEYIRNLMKRVRKKESAVVLASQNIEDFLIPSVRELTKPLFSIPTHQFLFHPGQINPADFMDTLQVESSEYERIRSPEVGTCLYRCGNERYLLSVSAPANKAEHHSSGTAVLHSGRPPGADQPGGWTPCRRFGIRGGRGGAYRCGNERYLLSVSAPAYKAALFGTAGGLNIGGGSRKRRFFVRPQSSEKGRHGHSDLGTGGHPAHPLGGGSAWLGRGGQREVESDRDGKSLY